MLENVYLIYLAVVEDILYIILCIHLELCISRLYVAEYSLF